MPIDVETTETMNDLQAHFECGGVEVERDDRYVYIKVALNCMDHAIITRDQPIRLTVLAHRVEAEYVETYGEPDAELTFNSKETFDVVCASDYIETIRVRLAYDLSRDVSLGVDCPEGWLSRECQERARNAEGAAV